MALTKFKLSISLLDFEFPGFIVQLKWSCKSRFVAIFFFYRQSMKSVKPIEGASLTKWWISSIRGRGVPNGFTIDEVNTYSQDAVWLQYQNHISGTGSIRLANESSAQHFLIERHFLNPFGYDSPLFRWPSLQFRRTGFVVSQGDWELIITDRSSNRLDGRYKCCGAFNRTSSDNSRWQKAIDTGIPRHLNPSSHTILIEGHGGPYKLKLSKVQEGRGLSDRLDHSGVPSIYMMIQTSKSLAPGMKLWWYLSGMRWGDLQWETT